MFSFFSDRNIRQIRQICQILLISLNYEKSQLTHHTSNQTAQNIHLQYQCGTLHLEKKPLFLQKLFTAILGLIFGAKFDYIPSTCHLTS